MAEGSVHTNEGPRGLERSNFGHFLLKKKKKELPSIMSYHSLESGRSFKSPCLKKFELRKLF